MVAVVASAGYFRVAQERQKALTLAYEQKCAAIQANRAQKEAQTQSQRAEGNLQLAMRAFENVMDRVGARGLPESARPRC